MKVEVSLLVRAITPGILSFATASARAQYSFTDLRALGFGGTDLAGLSADGATILGSTAPSPFGGPIYIQNGQSFRLPIGNLGNGIARRMASDGTIVGGITPGMMGSTPSGARIQAALEGFGYLTSSGPLTCVNQTSAWQTLDDHDYSPAGQTSYAVWGMDFIGAGPASEFDCARQVIQELAVP